MKWRHYWWTTTTLVFSHLHKRIRDLVVHELGGVFRAVGAIEGELLGRFLWSRGPLDETLAALRVNGQHRPAPQSLLALVQGPAPDHHLHRLGAHVSSKVAPRPREVPPRHLVVVGLEVLPRTQLKRRRDGRTDGRSDWHKATQPAEEGRILTITVKNDATFEGESTSSCKW